MRDVEQTALAFDRACRDAHVHYAFVGGIAVAVWGQPRATADVDALVDLDPADASQFAAALGKEGLSLDARDVADARTDGSHVSAFDTSSRFHVDMKPTRSEAERAQVSSAVELEFLDGRIRVARPEETVAFKLKYGSEQDLQDAASILVRQEGKLDMARLRDFARRLGVEKGLDELLAEP